MQQAIFRIQILIAITLACPALARGDAATGLPVYVEDKLTIDPRDDGTERYLTLGLLTRPTGGAFGARAQLDLVGFAGFTLGAAGTLFGRAAGTLDDASMVNASAVGYLAYTRALTPRFKLRGQVGYGGMYRAEAATTATTDDTMTTGRTALVEGSLLLTVRGNHDWSVIGGPIWQRTVEADPASTVIVFVGLQRRF